MDIFNLLGFRKNQPVLVRCTYCYYEFHLSPREVRLLEKQNATDPVCPVKEECDICHIGFMILSDTLIKEENSISIMKLNRNLKT